MHFVPNHETFLTHTFRHRSGDMVMHEQVLGNEGYTDGSAGRMACLKQEQFVFSRLQTCRFREPAAHAQGTPGHRTRIRQMRYDSQSFFVVALPNPPEPAEHGTHN